MAWRQVSRRYWQAKVIVTKLLTMHKRVAIALADPVFDPRRQVSRKFLLVA